MTASERTWCGYPEAHSAAYYEHLRLSRYARQAERMKRDLLKFTPVRGGVV